MFKDPSRNHRAYRSYEQTLVGAIIHYFPLMMKDMTFQHEGNSSWKNNMLDFEKMVNFVLFFRKI